MIRVAIIGCGKIAQVRHIPEYLENKDAEIVGYFDYNHERAEELARKFGGKAYQTLDELLADPAIEAVSVCVPNRMHAEDTIKALRAGKHVLCEKPMATTLEESEEMVRAARESGKKLMIDQNQRLTKAHVIAKKLIQDGMIGRVVTFRTTFGHGGPETWSIDPGKSTWFFDKSKSGIGVMADLGVHKTDLIQYLLGQNVVATTARLLTLDKKDASGKPISVDDNAICIYEMEGGAVGTMTASWTYYAGEDNSTIIYGTNGTMRIYSYKDPKYSIRVNLNDGSEINYAVDKIQTNDNQTTTGIIDAFIDCIEHDHKPLIDGAEVLNAMRAVFASIESSQKGQRVVIK